MPAIDRSGNQRRYMDEKSSAARKYCIQPYGVIAWDYVLADRFTGFHLPVVSRALPAPKMALLFDLCLKVYNTRRRFKSDL